MSKIGIVARKFLKFHGLIAGALAISSIGHLQAASYTISNIAWDETGGYTGDGGAATSARLYYPSAICRDSTGNIYVFDDNYAVIRKIDTSNPPIITTIAGSGTGGYQDGTGTNTLFGNSRGMAVDSANNVYVAEPFSNVVRKIVYDGTTYTVSTVAGNNALGAGFSGNGGAATSARLNEPSDVAFDSLGCMYIADSGNGSVRKVNLSGTISTYAGSGSSGAPSGYGGLATSAVLSGPKGLCFDSSDNLYISDLNAGSVSKVNRSTGIITLFASSLSNPTSVLCDSANTIYVATDNYITNLSTLDTFGNVSGWIRFACIDPIGNFYLSVDSKILKLAILSTYTSYTPGPDEQDSSILYRFDRIQCGVQNSTTAGSFAAYTQPFTSSNYSSVTTGGTLVISIGSATSDVTPTVNNCLTGYTASTNNAGFTTLPTKVTTLWFMGDATKLATVLGSATGMQFPTPSNTNGGVVRFALTSSPSATCQWFCSALPANWVVYVEPASADPRLGVGILDAGLGAIGTSTNSAAILFPVASGATGLGLGSATQTSQASTLTSGTAGTTSILGIAGIVVGNAGITLPGTGVLANNTVTSLIQRKSSSIVNNFPSVTLANAMTFTKPVFNVCLTGAYAATLKASSVLSGQNSSGTASSLTGLTIGATSSATTLGSLGASSSLLIRNAQAAAAIPAITMATAANSASITAAY